MRQTPIWPMGRWREERATSLRMKSSVLSAGRITDAPIERAIAA